MNTPILTTEHLVLRPIQMEDAARVQLLFNDWEVVKWLAAVVPWPYPEDGAVEFLRSVLTSVASTDRMVWAIAERNDPLAKLIGVMDLNPSATGSHRGFWIAPAYHRRGYMSEAVLVTTDYAFDVLDMPILRLDNVEGNVGSHRLKEKAGAVIVGYEETQSVSGPAKLVKWNLTPEAWKAARATFLSSR